MCEGKTDCGCGCGSAPKRKPSLMSDLARMAQKADQDARRRRQALLRPLGLGGRR